MKNIVLGGGCFWCTEAVMQRVDGVESVTPGYAGGSFKDPTYEEVVSGTTGHAEVVSVNYDEQRVPLSSLLETFFRTHDPTSLNRQGADVGTQYRSVIFYSDDNDKKVIDDIIHTISQSLTKKIVTEVSKLEMFYEAESYHHDYYNKHPYAGYCQIVIAPKLNML